MPKYNMSDAIEEFILQRVNAHGENPSEVLTESLSRVDLLSEKLKNTLTQEQNKLYTKCENAYSIAIGENTEFYYKAGFADAIEFLMGWRDNKWS